MLTRQSRNSDGSGQGRARANLNLTGREAVRRSAKSDKERSTKKPNAGRYVCRAKPQDQPMSNCVDKTQRHSRHLVVHGDLDLPLLHGLDDQLLHLFEGQAHSGQVRLRHRCRQKRNSGQAITRTDSSFAFASTCTTASFFTPRLVLERPNPVPNSRRSDTNDFSSTHQDWFITCSLSRVTVW